MTTLDDDRTVGKGLLKGLGRASFDEPANALPMGTRLGEFELQSVIGEGGFGIVYLAHDHSLGRQVAIKEYMPAALAARTQALTVSVRSERDVETFAAGLRSFINEARLLAQFDHPSLLKVYRFWEANGTAYMVMPYYAGVTLSRTLKQRAGAPPDEAWLKDLLHHLLNALEQMHLGHCYHRDISPDNILIQPDGRPLLLDFGAARRVIGDMTRALTVILKTGYAPVEQYGEMPDMTQGAWTDLYALGSVVHFAIMGYTPPPAVQRFLSDKFEPLAQVAAGGYSERFLQAIDRSLAVLPKDRPQSAAELRALLGVVDRRQPAAPAAAAASSVPVGPVATLAPAPVAAVIARPTQAPKAPSLDIEELFPSRTAARAGDRGLAQKPAASASVQPSFIREHIGLGAVMLATVAIAAAGIAYLLFGLDGSPVVERAEQHPGTEMAAPAQVAEPAPMPVSPAEAPPATQAEHGANAKVDAQSVPAPTETLGAAGTSTPPAAAVPAAPIADAAPPQMRTASPQLPAQPSPSQRIAARPQKNLGSSDYGSKQLPNNKLSSRRCADIIQRVSLGEPLTPEEKDFLKQECGQ